MRVLIGNSETTLAGKRVLGDGGEATVVLHAGPSGTCAIKLYKQPSADRVPKLEALIAAHSVLAPYAAAPYALVHDARSGDVLGFAMQPVPASFEPLSMLAKPSFRAAAKVDLPRVLAILIELANALEALHVAGAVVGDLNDQNELFHARTKRLVFIDADSFQWAGFPCAVSTEAFLDPLLYGPDHSAPCVTRDGAPRWFGRGSDWYAFSVLAFRSLTGVHPFGGSTSDGQSLSERAWSQRSVLAADVALPAKARARMLALPEPLLDAFSSVFERGERRPLAVALIEQAAAGARTCSCGLELAGGVAHCPACTSHLPRSSGAVRAIELCAAFGELLAASASETLWFAVARAGSAYQLMRGRLAEPGFTSETLEQNEEGTEARMCGRLVALARRAERDANVTLFDATSGRRLYETATEVAFGQPCFAVSSNALFRIARGVLLSATVDAAGVVVERPLRTVVSGQTTLHGFAHGAFAVTLLFGRRSYLCVSGEHAVELEAEALLANERVVSEALLADGATRLLVRHTARGGHDRVRLDVFDGLGRAVQRTDVAASARTAGLSIAGGLCSGGAHLVASDRGLVLEQLAPPFSAKLFAGTEPFVVAESRLAASQAGILASCGGSLRLLSRTSH